MLLSANTVSSSVRRDPREQILAIIKRPRQYLRRNPWISRVRGRKSPCLNLYDSTATNTTCGAAPRRLLQHSVALPTVRHLLLLLAHHRAPPADDVLECSRLPPAKAADGKLASSSSSGPSLGSKARVGILLTGFLHDLLGQR